MVQGFALITAALYSNENKSMNLGRTINFLETGVLIYGCAIVLVNLKIFTFTYTNYVFTIFVIISSVILYWLCLLLLENDISSESFDFFRYLTRYSIL